MVLKKTLMKSKRVLLGVTGSVAAYKAGDIIRRLQDRDCDVTVMMTRAAQRFITPLTLASLSGKHVYTDMLDAANAWQMPHIFLAKEADVVLIAPATADVIAHLAHGLADDLLTCTAISTQAPIVLAPAMNDDMYANAAVQHNCGILKQRGMHIIEPVEGRLACNTTGQGHLADVDAIVSRVLEI